jgi:hypothetical protein
MCRVLFTIFLLISSFHIVADNLATPVIVGSDDNLDACPSLGVVSGLNPKRDGFLAVRSGASTKHALIDKLQKGQKVFICSTSKDGNWYGVVYSHGDVDDCGVTSPVNTAQPYKGKCKSGWVNAHWIKLLAG